MSMRSQTIRRGTPLATIALVLSGWIGVRAVTWEDPLKMDMFELPGAAQLLADAEMGRLPAQRAADQVEALAPVAAVDAGQMMGGSAQLSIMSSASFISPPLPSWRRLSEPTSAIAGHQILLMRAQGWERARRAPGGALSYKVARTMQRSGVSPLAPMIERAGGEKRPDRWSFDAWGFWRQGSNASANSPARLPIYGANQIGARLNYRAAPGSSHDPQLFLRGYRAIVSGGESEAAIGGSARPIGAIPVRVAAEMRATLVGGNTDFRPAVLATTELPPQDIVAGFKLEAYGAAGYVGGAADTHFADGQLVLTREVAGFEGPIDTDTRLSVGAGAWGGVQKDANRVDVGPTVRLDLRIGDVPARLSVDWREQVSGDALPNSGVAATLSTRF